MNQSIPSGRAIRSVSLGGIALAAALLVAACGGTASPATSVAVPSTAPVASVAAAPSAAASDAAPSAAPGGSAVAGVDAAAGLKIDAPYALTELPAAIKSVVEGQMSTSLGAFSGTVSSGFRLVAGGTGTGILMVMGFPGGSLNDSAYASALAAMSSGMGATFKQSTVDGVNVAAGSTASGDVAMFHIGDHMLIVIGQTAGEALPIATALIKANK